MFAGWKAAWCLLGERSLRVPKVRSGLVLARCEVAWCLLGETWLGVC